MVFDVESYIDQLEALPETFHPLSVCLYWKDLLMGRALPFLKRGIPVYTAGHMFDPLFYDNFYKILSMFRYATANHTFSSSNVLALEMGLATFFLGPDFVARTEGDDPNRQERERRETDFFDEIEDPTAREFFQIFPRYRPGMTVDDVKPSPRLREIVSIMHGSDAPIDENLIRLVIFQAYSRFHPQGKAYLQIVMENLALLQTGQYEAVFADQPDMLDFCRTICRYPQMVFSS